MWHRKTKCSQERKGRQWGIDPSAPIVHSVKGFTPSGCMCVNAQACLHGDRGNRKILSAAEARCCEVIPLQSWLAQQWDKKCAKSVLLLLLLFFCKGPDSKYFKLFRLHMVSVTYPSLLFLQSLKKY
ncbi:hypothetical protein HJG60_009699 [Phyllostomus discolor]|uniref:Uncharacterized protein n=1 Tax=Phyllostomus discolor TaxID=89673 RepID=A0A834B9T5_9CHIR|nr:hypothetical protein HJG60_009699 [Phyllostomus discolor]